MNYWMASDLNPQEMGGFASLLRGASASPPRLRCLAF
jgi:hypothetical protein